MSKINKKYSVDAKGVLCIEDGIITLLVEDVEEPVVLSELIEDFKGKEIKIAVNYGVEL